MPVIEGIGLDSSLLEKFASSIMALMVKCAKEDAMWQVIVFIMATTFSFAQDEAYEWIEGDFPSSKEERIEKVVPTVPEEEVVDEEPIPTKETVYGPTLFIEAEGGFSFLSSEGSEKELKGYQGTLKLGAKHSFSKSFDILGSIGWFYNKMDSPSDEEFPTKLQTNAFQFEVTPLYRVNSFSIGPSAKILFGTDVSFSDPVALGKEDEKNMAIFYGIRAGMKVGKGDAYINYSRDLNIENRSINQILIGYSFPFNIFSKKVKARNLASVQPKFAPEVKLISATSFKVVLNDQNGVYFNTDSDRISKRTKKYLLLMGRVLKKYPKVWKSLKVEGHADQRGTYQYNFDLSLRRARTVYLYLKHAGANSKKISLRGHSFSKPVDSGRSLSSLSKNRRVEMVFKGVPNPQRFMKVMEKIKILSLDM